MLFKIKKTQKIVLRSKIVRRLTKNKKSFGFTLYIYIYIYILNIFLGKMCSMY